MEESLTFSDALSLLKSGKSIRRMGWNGKGLTVKKASFDGFLDFFVLEYPCGLKATWVPSITDVLAEDWIEVL